MIYYEDIKKMNSYIESNIKENILINIKIDTKELSGSESFLALKGENHNSVKFIDSNLEKMCCFIYEDKYDNEKYLSGLTKEKNWIKVKDSVSFLQEVSRVISDKIKAKGGAVIAVSGSNGKTTTRQMIEHLFSQTSIKFISTQKNNNNHIGVPLTMLQADEETELAIIELGSNHPGEIETLCEASNPSHGVCTNIGATHMEFFGTLEKVFVEESYLFDWIRDQKNTLFLVNKDDKHLSKINSEVTKSFGINGENYQFTIEKNKITINYAEKFVCISNRNITGEHNLFNLGVAFILSREVYPEWEESLFKACESFSPTENRSEWKKVKDTNVFLDAYNANPSSMIASFEGFKSSIDENSKSLCVFGDMNELGSLCDHYHYELGSYLSKNSKFDIVFIGKFKDQFLKGISRDIRAYNNVFEYKKSFEESLESYDNIFIKGSRSLQLERLLDITLS